MEELKKQNAVLESIAAQQALFSSQLAQQAQQMATMQQMVMLSQVQGVQPRAPAPNFAQMLLQHGHLSDAAVGPNSTCSC